MQPRCSTLHDDWIEALSRSASRLSRKTAGGEVFVEERLDRSARLDLRTPEPRRTESRIRGLAVTEGDEAKHAVFLGDPFPEDAERLAGLEPGSPFPARSEGPSGGPGLSEEAVSPVPVEALRHALARLESGCRGAWAEVRWVDFDQRIAVARSEAAVVTDRRRGARLAVELRAESNGGVISSIREWTGNAPSTVAVERVVDSAIERLHRRRAARRTPSGPHVLVLAPGVGGILVHELVGHALEARRFKSARSWLGESREPVAPPGFSVLDDPRRGRAPWRIDDEGQPARPVSLIRAGAVRGWLDDLCTAARWGRSPSGHGRRAGFRDRVLPRMGCTFVAAGRIAAEEVLAGVERGIYVRRMEAARTDPGKGHALFRVTDADLIVGGRLDAPLRPHLLYVEGPSALSGVDRVADDLQFDVCTGSCVRDGQALAVGVGGPTFRTGLVTAIS